MSAAMTAALERLNDAICSFNRDCGRSYTLILAPAQADEPILCSLDGKPLREAPSPERMLEIVRLERGDAP